MTATAQPLVSIVTPVYNGAAYLDECVESVLRQSYQNWEYIILNNNSNDDTLEIAERHQRNDSRIRVHSNSSLLPIIANHNKAFSLISRESKYCKVVSADDWIFPECIERIGATCRGQSVCGHCRSLSTQRRRRLVRAQHWLALCAHRGAGQRDGSRPVARHSQGSRQSDLGHVPRRPGSREPRCSFRTRRRKPTPAPASSNCACPISASSIRCCPTSGPTMSAQRPLSLATNAYVRAAISDCQAYGESFLTKEECEVRIRKLLNEYYAYLARNTFKSAGRRVLALSRSETTRAGLPVEQGQALRRRRVSGFGLGPEPEKHGSHGERA